MDKVHSCEINLLLPSFSGYGVVRSSLLMRTPLCGPRLLRNFREESTWLLVQCWSIYQFLRMRKNHVSKFFFLCIFPSFKLLWFVHNRSWEGIKKMSKKHNWFYILIRRLTIFQKRCFKFNVLSVELNSRNTM